MRHIIIVALNFLHGGVTFQTLPLLGRRPNLVQQRVHERLWALVATCDTPGGEPFSAVPGRSGTEFLARLQELEHFAEQHPLLQTDHYAEGPVDFEAKKVGLCKPSASSMPFQPYTSLDSCRLKLVGSANWQLADYLEDELWMPYQEPRILHHQQPLDFEAGPDLSKESEDENMKLALLWDAHHLLALTASPPHRGTFSRVFNARKSAEHDRQIGDRRLANQAERHVQGPSRQLPIGYMITSIHVPAGHVITGAITDRKDFYHQASVTSERAASNVLPFCYPSSAFEGTAALEHFRKMQPRKKGRDEAGDRFGKERASLLVPDGSHLYPCFQSLFQGDHLGVEFALSAHGSLLEEAGLLGESSRILGGSPFPLGPVYEGLVIDDYFALAVTRNSKDHHLTSPALACFNRAVQHYDRSGVLGSPEKDIAGSRHFKVAGAEVNASEEAVSRGVVTISAPVQKRLSLAVLSLRVAALPVISSALATRLTGNWTSVLLYRRCLTCLLHRLYAFGSTNDVSAPDVFEFPRKVADELVLAAVLSFVAATDATSPFLEKLFATDASINKGAVVARDIPQQVAKVLWLGGDKRGAHVCLDGPLRQALKICGEDEGQPDPEGSDLSAGHIPATLDFSFDFVEVCGGAAETSSILASWGYSVMPPIELSDSPHYDLRDLKVVNWLCNMLKSKRLRTVSIMLEPVCTTFSPAAHPCVRSYAEPKGFCRTDAKTLAGNIIAFRCLYLAWIACLCDLPCLVEQPRLSKMCWLSIWIFLREVKRFGEAICASCQFGSPHRKEFRLLLWKIPAADLERRCPGGHQHVPIQGAFTKASAVYVTGLARHFARAFAAALDRDARFEQDGPRVSGVESVVASDLLVSGHWEEVLTWFWRRPSHINILESHAFLTLLRHLAMSGHSCRFNALLDSRVAKCSIAKGRSSALALGPSLKKSAALQVAFGLYPSLGFAPTKLNVADDPTRDTPLRPTDASSFSIAVPPQFLAQLHALPLSRPAAKWVRLVVLLIVLSRAEATVPEGATCGFSDLHWPGLWALERSRADRRSQVNLVADRVLRPQTRTRREALLTDFNDWLVKNAYESIDFLLEARDVDAEYVAELLVCYGKELYYAGKPYGRYSETINAVGARRPAIRKSLASAWDLAFSWVTDEPGAHHPAMPLAVVLAFSALALLWGWTHEAAIFLLAWCGILRVGEVLNGIRADLILPSDSTAGINYALFQIRQPKTRGSAAKHQSARIDPKDVINLLTAVFGKCARDQKLWLLSGSTLRKRFGQLQSALGLPTQKSGSFRPYDLASLRPGGATHLLQRFEDGEFVRRRGRWLSSRVMEIYLQEVAVATYESKIPDLALDRINRLAGAFPQICDRAIFLLESAVPPSSWPFLWTDRQYNEERPAKVVLGNSDSTLCPYNCLGGSWNHWMCWDFEQTQAVTLTTIHDFFSSLCSQVLPKRDKKFESACLVMEQLSARKYIPNPPLALHPQTCAFGRSSVANYADQIHRSESATLTGLMLTTATVFAVASSSRRMRKLQQMSDQENVLHQFNRTHVLQAASRPAARAAGPTSKNSTESGGSRTEIPLIFRVTILAVTKHTKSSGRFEVVTVLDPEFADFDCTLTVVVRAGEFQAGESAFFIPVGTTVPEDLARRCGWEGLLAESGFIVKPSHFGRDYLSNGLLLPSDLVDDVSCQHGGPELKPLSCTTSELHDIAAALGLSHAPGSAWCARSFLLELGFDNSYYGSQWTGTEDQRPTVVGQILGAVERLGLCTIQRPRMSQWVALSRVDSGVSARSFKVTTAPLTPAPNSDVAKIIASELPSNISIHRAIAIPRGVQLSPAQRIIREYGYYFPSDVVGSSFREHLEAVLQCFCGGHCFANFTELKKLEGLKKKIQRDKELQMWAHKLQSWKRSRIQEMGGGVDPLDEQSEMDHVSPVSTIKVHQAMQAACKRNILSIVVEAIETLDTELMCIRIKGDGFLYNMVRYLVGSALAVVTGRLSAETLETALESSICVDLSEHLAPAHGLVLLDQSLESEGNEARCCPWMSESSDLAALSADQFLEEQLLPKIQEAWHQNDGWLREKNSA
eukprot:s1267_g41.t1